MVYKEQKLHQCLQVVVEVDYLVGKENQPEEIYLVVVLLKQECLVELLLHRNHQEVVYLEHKQLNKKKNLQLQIKIVI